MQRKEFIIYWNWQSFVIYWNWEIDNINKCKLKLNTLEQKRSRPDDPVLSYKDFYERWEQL